MKKLKSKKTGRILVGALILLMIVAITAPSLQAGVCERALAKCGVDAAIAGITGGAGAGVIWGLGCLAGYDWCKRYIF